MVVTAVVVMEDMAVVMTSTLQEEAVTINITVVDMAVVTGLATREDMVVVDMAVAMINTTVADTTRVVSTLVVEY